MNAPTLVSPPADRLHVLQVLGNGIVGGMESYVLRLVQRLPKDRFRVTAVLPYACRLADLLRDAGAEFVAMPMPEEPLWTSTMHCAALVRHGGVDLLHAHMPNAHRLAALAGHLVGRPVLTTIHSRQLDLADVEAHHAVGSHFAVVCAHTYYHALAMGIDPAFVTLIPNGVDLGVFGPGVRGDALRAALNVEASTPLVGFVGRLSPEKGPDMFVRAAAIVCRRLPAAHAVLVGEGPMEAELRATIDELGCSGRIHLAGLRTDIPDVLRELDVVASTSHTEAMPLALMEALASGVPVVAMRVGGVPDIVDHCASGFLAGVRDVEGVADRVSQLLRNPDERRQMGENARASALRRFDIDACVHRTAELMAKLAGRGTRPAATLPRRFRGDAA